MVLINDYNLVDGSEWTADLANLAFNPVFNDQTQFLNNHPRLTDDSLSNVAGSVKPRLNAIEGSLTVTATTGANIIWSAGTVALPDGTVQNVAAGGALLPNNDTSFIWVDIGGVVRQGVSGAVPAIRLMLARVVTSGGVIMSVENRRSLSIRPIQPVASAIKVFGGAFPTDFDSVNNATYSGGYIFCKDFIIPQGRTIFINGYVKVFASGTVNILGTIITSAPTAGATPFTTFGVVAGVNFGGQSGAGLGAGSGSGGVSVLGQTYSYAASPLGSGGAGGFVSGASSSVSLQSSTGGRGGGCLWIEAAGTLTVGATGNIQCNGTTGIPGAVAGGNGLATGGGGGSGGLIYLSSLVSVTLATGALLNANGASGSAGVAVPTTAGGTALGGGGGGGGWVVLAAPLIANATAISVTGGAIGTPGGTGTPTGGGGGGSYAGGGGSAGGTVPLAGAAGQVISLFFSPVGL
jgi:hypothetical protein